jgi:hypothetical protein
MGGEYSTYGKRRFVSRVLVGKPQGKKELERPRGSWQDNIKMDLQEVEWWARTELIWLWRWSEPSGFMKCRIIS